MDSPNHSSPDSEHLVDGQQSIRKRKRKTFSCDACRKRKLKCTRELPVCSRCQKSGNAANCVYENPPEPTQSPGFGGATLQPFDSRAHYSLPNQAADRLAALEQRIAALDPRIPEVSFKRTRLDSDANTEPVTGTRDKDSSGISVYGGGFKTVFFGPSSERNNITTYYPAVMKMFPEFKVFISFHNLQNPLFAQARTHIRSIRKNTRAAKKIMPYPSVITLHDAVPDKDTCTKMVSLYWETVANTYHIFHRPTFWTLFWLYWSDPQQRTEAFACTMLLMLACVNALERQQTIKYRGLSSVPREQASYWIEICDSWIQRQSRKHLTIESFQNRVLLTIAKKTNTIKMKQVWERATELLAFAISTGLHQDPTKIDATYAREHARGVPLKPTTTPYEREMRRRLWAAVVELEMQASFDKGLPSSRLVLLADCGPPVLLDDEQFNTSSSTLPASEARSKFTAVSYLYLSQETLGLRAALSEIVNTGAENLSYGEVLAYDDEIIRALNDLPQWTRDRNTNAPSTTDQHSATPAALLELQLLQFQLILHVPSSRRPGSDSRTNLSRMTCIDCSVRILSLHVQLAQSNLHSPGLHWLNLMREDVFRAILITCYNTVLWRGLNTGVAAGMKDIYSERILQGLDILKHKVLTLGEQFLQIWHALAALGMLRSSLETKSINVHVSTLADELSAIFGSIVNAQEEPTNEQTAAGALTALATPSSGGYDLGNDTAALRAAELAGTQGFIDGVDMNTWGGFEDLWPFSSGTGLSW